MTSEQITAWTSLGTMIGMIAVGVMNQISDRRRKVEAEEAKKKAEEALAVNKATHLLVNSAMLEQLFIGMVAAESLNAAQPNKVNQDLASEARRKYEEHKRKQAEVDATSNPKTMNGKSSDG